MKSPSKSGALGAMALFAPLIVILIAAVWFAVDSWIAMAAAPMPLAGYVAMGAGIALTLIVGVGLMSLLFYSRRHGYDEAADRGRRGGDDDDETRGG